ncbi:FAD-dependent oxidoreductase [Streptomyces sp. NPDC058304]|uniref:FAD-dependent oxidoreductase n=1 Tax=Streptomyces sp. NPDC058304 TaxID=3346437 RepID=UPI0036EB1A28
MRHHDLVIIGAGSGNAVVDDSFADLDVAIVEERWFGGTCLNAGCIPSKMLAYTAHVARTVREAGAYDVDAELRAVRWREVRDRIFARLDAERDEGRTGREQQDSVTVYEGRARFTGPRTLRIDRVDGALDVSAGQIVVAAGGRPVVPGPVAAAGLPYETSDTVIRIDAPPRHLAILGGGYIAAELAEQDCRDRGLDYLVGMAGYGDVAYGWAMEDTAGFCKVLADPGTGRLLGAHLMGPQAPTLIQPLVLAATLGIDAITLAKSPYWIHPALTEVVENALLDLGL